MTTGDAIAYAFVAFIVFAVGFFGWATVCMVRQFLATGSMMSGPASNDGSGEREDPLGHRSYGHDRDSGGHD